MSLSPPRHPKIGDVWVDSFTAERFIFTGESTRPGEAFDGWELWSLENERLAFAADQGGEEAEPEQVCSHGKAFSVHCNQCEMRGYCGCPECTEQA